MHIQSGAGGDCAPIEEVQHANAKLIASAPEMAAELARFRAVQEAADAAISAISEAHPLNTAQTEALDNYARARATISAGERDV